MSPFNNWKIIVILCLTLGLAPYFPEPHIVGKIRWIAGGGNGMKIMDWFDTILHGFPFVLLIIFIVHKFSNKNAS
ncbi:MAG: hypothetical protein K9I95_00975 [Flavobacteriaceae bacterium]|nr:hypothetical protein [Flavobacteriaceae bacterium]